MKDEKRVPKLRFKGFTDDWEQCKLGDVTSSYSGGTPTASTSNYYGGAIPFIRSGEISKDSTELTITEEGLNNSAAKLVKRGDILYALYGATSGEVSISRLDGAINQAILAIKPCIGYDSYLLMSLLKNEKKKIREKFLQGGQGNLSARIVKNIKLDIPSINEQTKIGCLLLQLDRTITLHEEKKRQLERLKRALLQKMFADKSGYPAVRFKGFDDIWDQEKLNSLVRLHRGLTYSPNNVQDSGIRVLRSSNILDGQFVMTDDDIFVKSSVVNIPTVKDGDILITAANGSIKLVGKHAIISGISENTAVSGGFMLVGSSRIPDFVNSLFDTSWYQRFIRKYVTGGNGSIGNLKKNDLDKQYVKVPTTSEQGRIGEFFREIDQLIINNQIKHEKLLELKKFLLQNMFI